MATDETRLFDASDGAKIVGTLRRPELSCKGSVLLLHGITTCKDEYLGFLRTVAGELAGCGYMSLRFDFRGHGESGVPPEEFTVGSQILDVSAAISLLSAESGKVPSVLACSFGAPPAIFMKAWQPDRVGTLCLLAPVLDYRRVFLEPETQWGNEAFPRERLVRALETGQSIELDGGFRMGPRLIASMLHSDVDAWIDRVPTTVRIVHGDADGMVPIDISRRAAARHPNLHLREVPNMEHGFTEVGDEVGTSPASLRNIALIVHALLEEGAK